MKIQNALLYGFGVVMLVSSGAVVYMTFLRDTEPSVDMPAQLGAVSDGSLEQYASKQNPNTKQAANGGLSVTENQSSSTPLPAAQKSNQQAQTNKNSLLDPSQFEQYEQYADSASTVYQEITVGSGAEAASGATAVVVYTGWLTNGEIFDQSRKNEAGQLEAFSFQLGAGQVIRGWEEGVAGMKVGGKRRLVIPSSSGYGPSGQGSIPPNAMLIFDVELVSVSP